MTTTTNNGFTEQEIANMKDRIAANMKENLMAYLEAQIVFKKMSLQNAVTEGRDAASIGTIKEAICTYSHLLDVVEQGGVFKDRIGTMCRGLIAQIARDSK